MENLPSWREGPTKQAIVDYVEQVNRASVPPPERIAVFDNDGTLWCEKPTQIQIGFILERLVQATQHDPALCDRQPWTSAVTRDYSWLDAAMVKHYQGDDADLKVLIAAVLRSFAGVNVEELEVEVGGFLRESEHPTLGRPYVACGYQPMAELLRYLEANGFTTYIASGGDRDFMRPVTHEMYGIARERVIGSSYAMEFRVDEHGSAVLYKPELEFFDDGPVKPVRIWSRIGRRPLFAAGNANGDIPMLQFSQHPTYPSFRLLVLHDDDVREMAYEAGAEDALALARSDGWTVASMQHDWSTVFSGS